ncbi:MAG: NAD(P)/FAD-dependent oxidoreductase [Thermodesulfobacteriota bacterium]|nr:NAD(P)/FAD-dependent oxidoreductase [Thermodesulfobacteriota bacterium]
MDYDVIIIGGGMSGLAAGIRLAYYDKKVCILEKHYRIGGLNSYYVKDGHKFDVGLHAITNYVPRGVKSTPLPKLLRQLRLKHEDFDLCEQGMSMIKFPDRTLRFTNNLDFFVEEVVDNFPGQADNFQKLIKTIFDYNALSLDTRPISAFEVVGSILSDPLLIDMIFCPLMFYGNAMEDDMDFGQFVIMFQSIFNEGFARPWAGVRQILDVLINKYKENGGELRLSSGIKRITVKDEKAESILLESDDKLTADNIISSAGYLETMRLLSDYDPRKFKYESGRLSFIEYIMILDREPAEIGYEQTITFFNHSDRFKYAKAKDLVDVSSGVICCPNNFQYKKPLPEPIIRATNIANFNLWNELEQKEYEAQKVRWLDTTLKEIVKFIPDFRSSIRYTDIFTPKTIHRFTGHINGAVYGGPNKIKTGRTHLKNLFICGTDQGFLGIVGAMLSGISMANLHILMRE